MTYRYMMGAISDAGASPYQITGDRVVALIAQLNRFAGKTVNPGGGCGARNYLPAGPLALATTLDFVSATKANLIMYDRLDCISDVMLKDSKRLAVIAAAASDPVSWAMSNLSDITVQIAQFADSLDLPAASVGITKRDPKVTPGMSTTTMLIIGAAVVGTALWFGRKR